MKMVSSIHVFLYCRIILQHLCHVHYTRSGKFWPAFLPRMHLEPISFLWVTPPLHLQVTAARLQSQTQLRLYPWHPSSSGLQKRQILVTLVEVALPLLFSAILIVLRQKVPSTSYPNGTHYESFSVSSLPFPLSFGRFQFAYIPGNSSVVRQVAEDVQRSLGPMSIHSGQFPKRRRAGRGVCRLACLRAEAGERKAPE